MFSCLAPCAKQQMEVNATVMEWPSSAEYFKVSRLSVFISVPQMRPWRFARLSTKLVLSQGDT